MVSVPIELLDVPAFTTIGALHGLTPCLATTLEGVGRHLNLAVHVESLEKKDRRSKLYGPPTREKVNRWMQGTLCDNMPVDEAGRAGPSSKPIAKYSDILFRNTPYMRSSTSSFLKLALSPTRKHTWNESHTPDDSAACHSLTCFGGEQQTQAPDFHQAEGRRGLRAGDRPITHFRRSLCRACLNQHI